jgi:hypothetical protein
MNLELTIARPVSGRRRSGPMTHPASATRTDGPPLARGMQ